MHSNRIITAAVVAGLLAGVTQVVRADVDIDTVARQTVKSLVVVEYTVRNENVSQDESGQGLVLSKDGLILIPGSTIPDSFPKEWIKDIKVRVPGKNFESVPAKFWGRTRDRLFAYLKTTAPIDATVFSPGTLVDSKLGEKVFSVAMLGKGGGYQTYVGVAHVKAIMDLTHTLVGTESFGLTRGMSPVYDAASGNIVGLTMPALGDTMVLRDSDGARQIQLIDQEQSSVYLPRDEITDVLTKLPTAPLDLKRAWLAVDELSGLEEDVREGKHIQQPSGVMIGAVIPGQAADKAGVQPRDIVLTVDGKQFSTSPVPDLMVQQFSRAIDRHKPGDEITLGVLRDSKHLDLKVTLGTYPKTGAEMAQSYSSRVGVVTRDLAFLDLYARKLPQDTKGVMVALVKNGSPAALGTTPLRSGYLIQKVDDQPVENEAQFEKVLQSEVSKPDLKELVFVVMQSSGDTQVCRVDMTK